MLVVCKSPTRLRSPSETVLRQTSTPTFPQPEHTQSRLPCQRHWKSNYHPALCLPAIRRLHRGSTHEEYGVKGGLVFTETFSIGVCHSATESRVEIDWFYISAKRKAIAGKASSHKDAWGPRRGHLGWNASQKKKNRRYSHLSLGSLGSIISRRRPQCSSCRLKFPISKILSRSKS